ncbi:hypothetical protein A9993_25135 [Rahnella victoriana]|uniref:DUF4123 domain-containing protein n=1 Tax=Rahnella victoriana TaxID=1510570 RepID=UPI000BB1E571|nr:DUF4123 domain-containing protein [Rahnella victoriana]PBI78117.1 hypothetical protein A9993_25135 [Rahnella victoriana]
MNPPFTDITQYLIGTTHCSAYALVDGLQFERYYGTELVPQSEIVIPLFSKWPDSRIAFAGPWLIQLNGAMQYHKKLQQLENALPAVSWIASSLTPEDLSEHLKRFMNVFIPDGKTALLRFWDPRVAERLAMMLDELQHEDLLNNIEEWLYTAGGTINSLRWRRTS